MKCSECEKGNHKQCHDIRIDTMYPPTPIIFQPGPESGYYDKDHPNEWQIVPMNVSHENVECMCKTLGHRDDKK